MATNTNAFDDIDPKTESKSSYGVSAARKAQLSSYDAPLHVLDAKGIDVPHREFHPEDATEYPTTITCGDTRVSLHQDVKEQSTDAFGDFGAAADDTDDITWTVVDLTDGTVTLTVVGDWGNRREVPVEEFADQYTPITTTNGVPQFGY
jgi:hypothetical protein